MQKFGDYVAKELKNRIHTLVDGLFVLSAVEDVQTDIGLCFNCFKSCGLGFDIEELIPKEFRAALFKSHPLQRSNPFQKLQRLIQDFSMFFHVY